MQFDYSEPVASLLSCGKPDNKWPDYISQFGISLSDVPHLTRMLNDTNIKNADHNDPVAWADIHAWRTIGQLKAIDAIDDLIACLACNDDEFGSDWVMEELPKVFSLLGGTCIEPLSNYLNDGTKGEWGRITAAHSLCSIAQKNPEYRSTCIEVLTAQLRLYENNEDNLNSFLISYLTDLQAVESLDVIRAAFQAERVDIWVGGDLEDVEIDLKVRETRSTPRPKFFLHGSDCSCEHHRDELLTTMPRISTKIERNEPCPCGSGKKYKKCCLTY